MSGLNTTTGRAIGDLAHIWQSVRDILTTPIGSRVMRRDYGSLIPELIDQRWQLKIVKTDDVTPARPHRQRSVCLW